MVKNKRNKNKGKTGYVKPIDKEYVDIVFKWEINGKLYQKKKKRLYSRGRSSMAFELENAAQLMYFWDKICSDGVTYADYALNDLKNLLPNRSGLSTDELLKKYWVEPEKYVEEEFEKYANGEIDRGYIKTYEEYVMYRISCLLSSFSQNALLVKQGLLWYIFKYIENSSVNELQSDIDLIPDKIKRMVDKLVQENSKKVEDLKVRNQF